MSFNITPYKVGYFMFLFLFHRFNSNCAIYIVSVLCVISSRVTDDLAFKCGTAEEERL